MRASLITCARNDKDSYELNLSIVSNTDHSIEVCEMVGYASIGEGYNAGVKQAQGDVLVFTHTDVLLWSGPSLWYDMLDLAEEEKVGFVGVAGTKLLKEDAVWWDCPQKLSGVVFHENEGSQYGSAFGPFGRVVVLDGVFLACHRRTLERIGPWPEGGWHFYDIEMTLRAHLAGLENYTVPLPLLHKSIGPLTPEWDASRSKFYKKFKDKLPVGL